VAVETLTVLLAVAACGIAIKVWVDAAEWRRYLDRRLASIVARLDRLEQATGTQAPPAAAPTPHPSSRIPAGPDQALPAQPSPEVEPAPAAEAGAAPMAAMARVPPAGPPLPAAGGFAALEDRVMRNWLVWLGALALALGAVFLVRYSIERGFFGPVARVISGVLVGLALVAAGEWTRRHPPAPWPGVGVQSDHVPPALSAAGVIALFASIYAADALYALVPPFAAFVLLAGVSAAAALLSLLHGRFMALLGFIGAYGVPALIATPHPTAAGLLIYVALVTAGALALERWHDWAPLGWTIAAGAMVWGGMALLLPDRMPALGVYLVAMPALFALIVPAEPRRPRFVWLAAIVDALLLVALVIVEANDAESVAFAGALCLLLGGLGLRDPGYDRFAWVAGVVAVLVLAAWDFPRDLGLAPPSSYVLVAPPAALSAYLMLALLAAAVAGLGGTVAMMRAPQPARWAFLAAATPVAILVVAYWRAERFETSLPWAAVALALAAANVFAAERAPARRALAAHAVAAVASLSLALTMSLRLGWLTVALSLQLPALVWVFERTGVRAVRLTALVLSAIVLVRLLLNPSVAAYELGSRPILNPLLYTYGVPWLAFLAASRGFRRAFRRMGLATMADIAGIGALVLGFFYLLLEVRHLFRGEFLLYGRASDAEWYAYSATWLAYGLALLLAGMLLRQRAVRLAGLAVGAVVACKVFVLDLAALSGLLRAASFLGLGASFIGLGFLYQRLARPAPGAPGGTAT
jgi:uncharacterized membrane protein